MKMMMRLQKAQLPSSYKWAAGSGAFNKDLHEITGYQNFQATLVGASGGRSGDAYGVKGSTSPNISYGAGGGGGGFLHVQGALTDLGGSTPYSIGTKGADGKTGANTVTAGAGAVGGNTSFGPHWAQGGRGGVGGRISEVGEGVSYVASKGGAGGGNSAGVGSAGAGGNPTPTDGQYASSGNFSGGGGGGGGGGRVKTNGTVRVAATVGADGVAGSSYTAPGGSTASYKGGGGGGANVGTSEHYGSIATGHDPDGVIILTLT